MGDLIFVAVVVAFFALTVAYVRGCERIVGRDTGTDASAGAGAEGDLAPVEAIGGRR
jgi:hypothetical protein